MPEKDSRPNLAVSGAAMLVLAAIVAVILWWLVPATLAMYRFENEPDVGHHTHRRDPRHTAAWALASLDAFLVVSAGLLAWTGLKSLVWSVKGEPDDAI
jgi:hypothetical protein